MRRIVSRLSNKSLPRNGKLRLFVSAMSRFMIYGCWFHASTSCFSSAVKDANAGCFSARARNNVPRFAAVSVASDSIRRLRGDSSGVVSSKNCSLCLTTAFELSNDSSITPSFFVKNAAQSSASPFRMIVSFKALPFVSSVSLLSCQRCSDLAKIACSIVLIIRRKSKSCPFCLLNVCLISA